MEESVVLSVGELSFAGCRRVAFLGVKRAMTTRLSEHVNLIVCCRSSQHREEEKRTKLVEHSTAIVSSRLTRLRTTLPSRRVCLTHDL